MTDQFAYRPGDLVHTCIRNHSARSADCNLCGIYLERQHPDGWKMVFDREFEQQVCEWVEVRVAPGKACRERHVYHLGTDLESGIYRLAYPFEVGISHETPELATNTFRVLAP